MLSSPHEFLKVTSCRKLGFLLPFIFFNFSLATDQLLSACLGVETGDWIHKNYRVIHRLVIETQDPLHSPVSRPFICINQRAWLHVSLNNRQKRSIISPSD